MTDREYRELCKSSPQNARDTLYDTYFSYVYTIVFNKLRSCAPKEDIEECVSDVFADVFRHLSDENGKNGDIKGFIGTVAVRRAINVFHRITAASGRNVPMEESGIDAMADDTDIADMAEKAELRRVLLRSVEELGEPDSVIIIQKYYYGMTSKEIAERLYLEPAAVRARCSRALRRLRDKLAELDIYLKEAES